jgi:hypothetical protein
LASILAWSATAFFWLACSCCNICCIVRSISNFVAI